jgi:hypothetical protein
MEIKNDNHSLHKIFISTGKWCFLLNEKQGLFVEDLTTQGSETIS